MRPKPDCQRGDVVLVLFPHSNLQSAKTRPAVVVQADNLQTGLPQIVVAMITSQMSRAGHASRVSIPLGSPAGQQSGLLADSIVMTDNLATVMHKAVSKIIGSLPMAPVDAALRHTLGL
jgi:mRNA interferase MazF